MALDAGLLETVDEVIARRYTWAPPALSLGKFQELEPVPGLPFEVVRRPTGGRAVLHGEGFEWSFAVAFPPGVPTEGPRAAVDVGGPYGLVAAAFAAALRELGVTLDGSGETPYQRSGALLRRRAALRHLLPRREARRHRPGQEGRTDARARVRARCSARRTSYVLAVEALVGEPWEGEGLAGAGVVLAPETIWNSTLPRLEAALRRIAAG